MIWRLYFLCVIILFFLYSCKIKHQNTDQSIAEESEMAMIFEGKQLLQDGDLIMRADDDIVSTSLRNFSQKDKTYSHCGIAYFEDTTWFVYHLMAGDENPSEIIKKENFDSFVSPHIKTGFGIFRYSMTSDEQNKMKQQIHLYFAQKIHFDKKFDLKSDDQMYCAEMVYKGLRAATKERIILPITERENYSTKKLIGVDTATIKHFKYVAMDNLYMNPYCREIKRYCYFKNSLEKKR